MSIPANSPPPVSPPKISFLMQTLPVYSKDLIAELDKLYPQRCPDINMPERSIWWTAGQRQLVDGLILRLQEAEENSLEPMVLTHGQT
jgi:hypothetical protein